MFQTMNIPVPPSVGCFQLACNEQAPVQAAPKDKGNKPMCYDCDCCCDSQENLDVTKNDHAENRIRSLFFDKQRDLRKQFNIDDMLAPSTFQELIDRITNKQYTLRDLKGLSYWDLHNPFAQVIWRSPDVTPDHDGFKKADTALQAFRDSQIDNAVLGDDTAKLAAIKAMQDWTYTA